MAKWFPQPDECFVFAPRQEESEKIPVVLLVQGGEEPQQVTIDGIEYLRDAEREELVRMYVRVAERKRLGEDLVP